MAAKEEKETWLNLGKEFLGETTFHGWRFILADTVFTARRVIWLILCLTSLGLFITLVVDRAMLLNRHPRSIDLQVIYNESMAFPSVTFCNQNLFRKSAAHKHGLYDIIQTSFSKNTNFADKFEVLSNHYIEGFEEKSNLIEYYSYKHVTLELCKDVCEKLKTEECCSMVYWERTGDCFITPLNPNETSSLSIEPMPGATYLKRKSCETKSGIECDFEGLSLNDNTPCDFVPKQRELSWKLTESKNKLRGPSVDNSEAGNGSYMHAYIDYRINEPAELSSRDLQIKEKTCLQFFYQVTSGILLVNTTKSNNKEKTVWTMSSRQTGSFEYARVELEPGYQRIKFLATWDDNSDTVTATIDDILVQPCPKIKECKRTIYGLGYEGTMAVTASGTKCQYWGARDSFFKQWTDEIKDGYLKENYCRNPDGDSQPWCFVNHETGQAEYCDVDMCLCGPNEFQCDESPHKKCLSKDRVCDGYAHCRDYTDEKDCEKETVSGELLGAIGVSTLGEEIESGIDVNCTFDNSGCGFQIHVVSKGKWSISRNPYPEDINAVEKSVTLKGEESDVKLEPPVTRNSRDGAVAIMASPPIFIDEPHCLELELWMTATTMDVYSAKFATSMSTQYIATVFPTPSDYNFPDNLDKWSVIDKVHIDIAPQLVQIKVNGTETNDTMGSRFHLLFKSVVDDTGDGLLIMDNTLLLQGTCEEVERTTVAPPTTEFTTVEMNFTDNATEAWDFMTTPMPDSTDGESQLRRKRQIDQLEFDDDDNPLGERVTGDEEEAEVTESPGGLDLNTTDWWEFGNATDMMSTEAVTTEVPVVGGALVRAVANKTFCETCPRPLSTKDPNDCFFDPVGIKCRFDEGCGCGYTYFSSNTNDKWVVYHPDEDNATDPNKYREFDDSYAKAVATPGLRDRTVLLSPIETLEATSCLKFLYMTKYANLTVKQYTESSTETRLQITMDASDLYWHRAQVTLQPDTFGILFEFEYDDDSPDGIVAIDDVALLSGECFEFVDGGQVNCSFDEFDHCGYKDVSPDTYNWFRSKGYQDSPGTQYYIRTRKTSRGKMSRKLLSPRFELEEDSCLQFYYFMQSYHTDDLATFAVSLAESREKDVLLMPNNTRMVWAVRSITDNKWHRASTGLEAGSYAGLLFEINGDEYRGGIAEIVVSPGECPDTECLEPYFFQCKNGTDYMACVPSNVRCNTLPNCDLGLDEAIELECPKPQFTTVWADNSKMLGEGYSTKLASDSNKIKELNVLYEKLGPNQDDFISDCKFEGEKCGEYIKQQPTDYGMCYTFNWNETNVIETKSTGATFGLSLTLNIEQDEYIVGPNPDAGIKMFLHPVNEVPQVRDLGFAVAPGTHTLVGIMRNEANNLRHPWGDCSDIDLEYYDDYVFSACQLECKTKELNNKCYCRDAYMPYKTTDGEEDPPVCSPDKYFSCVVDHVYNSKMGNITNDICPECPKPCHQNVYEGSLSYSELSKLSVDTMLKEEMKLQLMGLRQTALAAQYRTTDDFIESVMVGETLMSNYRSILQLTDRNFADRNDTAFRIALMATKTMAEVAIDDVEALFSHIESQIDSYAKLYERTTSILKSKLEDVDSNLNMIQELFVLETGGSVGSLAREASEDLEIAIQTLTLLMKKYDNRTLAVENYTEDPKEQADIVEYLPLTFFESEAECLATGRELNHTLAGLRKILDNMARETRSNLTRLTNNFDDIQNSIECLEQYDTKLEEIKQWRKDEMAKIKELSDFTTESDAMEELMTQSDLQTMEADYKATIEAVKGFMQNSDNSRDEISRFLTSLKGEDGQVYSRVKRYLTQMESRVSSPITTSVTAVKAALTQYYLGALEKAAQTEVFLLDDYYYDKGLVDKMQVWKLPIINRKDYTNIKTVGRELWKVWTGGVTVGEFLANNTAKTEINKALNGYFGDITRNLDKFATDHSDLESDFRSAFDEIDDRLSLYTNQYRIDHTFIQENFLKVDVYFKQLKFQQVNQTKSYQTLDFLGDFGGYLGLLLGGSVLSMFELFDFCCYNGLRRNCSSEGRKKRNGRNGHISSRNGVTNGSYVSNDDVNVQMSKPSEAQLY